mmetsp:Transcript_30220/g.34600  ORF Transcript_30220/g.34600 Transcript_30220/m.34600 type:complete len:199 (+) Transcript_30220:266-862(+)
MSFKKDEEKEISREQNVNSAEDKMLSPVQESPKAFKPRTNSEKAVKSKILECKEGSDMSNTTQYSSAVKNKPAKVVDSPVEATPPEDSKPEEKTVTEKETKREEDKKEPEAPKKQSLLLKELNHSFKLHGLDSEDHLLAHDSLDSHFLDNHKNIGKHIEHHSDFEINEANEGAPLHKYKMDHHEYEDEYGQITPHHID